MAMRECTNCGAKMLPFVPRKNGLCSACQVGPRRNYVSAGKENLGATAMGAGEDLGNSIWEGMARAQGYHDAEHMQMAKQNHMHGVLHERYGDDNGGEHGIDEAGDAHYTVHHPSGWSARTFGGPYLEIGHRATPGEAHDAIDVSQGEVGEHARIHPAMTNGSPEGNHHMVKQHLDAWVNDYGDDYASSIPKIKRYNQVHGIGKASSLTVVAHDSGDGESIYHCPFCGSGQVIARSDKTIECEFCHTCFTVQVQPQYSAFPQTIDGQPVQVPGMPGQVGPADPMAGGMPPGDPGQDPGMDGQDGAVPPDGVDPDAEVLDDGSAPPGADDEDDDDDSGGGGKPPWLKGGAKVALRTATGAELDPAAYMRHLALRHASPDERESVLARVREDATDGR